MADFVNHVAVMAPRNGTTSHTVTPNSGTVVSGSAFTPTAGRLLVCAEQGAVTSTTPAGWTLPTNGSAVNNTGLYVWWKVAAGSDSLTTTHNGSNYPCVFDFFEFPSTSAFVKSAAATGVTNGGAGPTISALTGTNWIAGAVGFGDTATFTVTWTWTTGTEVDEAFTLSSGTTGVSYSLAALDSSALTSTSFAATYDIGGATEERLMFAVSVSAGAPAVIPLLTTPPMRR